MPTYEYRCSACGHAFERFQKMSDDPVRDCPECGEASAERVISSGAGLIFKGSGFYETDYKKKGTGGKKGASGGSSDDSGSSPGAGGDGGESASSDGGDGSADD